MDVEPAIICITVQPLAGMVKIIGPAIGHLQILKISCEVPLFYPRATLPWGEKSGSIDFPSNAVGPRRPKLLFFSLPTPESIIMIIITPTSGEILQLLKP